MHKDGNFSRSTVMSGIMMLSPYRQTSAAVTVCSPSEEPSAMAKQNPKTRLGNMDDGVI
jgi:hypothetical protein